MEDKQNKILLSILVALILFLGISVFNLLLVSVPGYAVNLQSLNSSLPWLTQLFLSISHFTRINLILLGLMFLLGLAAIILLAVFSGKKALLLKIYSGIAFLLLAFVLLGRWAMQLPFNQ